MEYLQLIASIAAGLVTAIPLVIKLVEYVKKAIKEKNWNIILNMVMNYMAIAEEKFETGAERKEWVLSMIESSADTVDYEIDLDVISNLIDNLCSMSKQINVNK